jgi:hypothetical protein
MGRKLAPIGTGLHVSGPGLGVFENVERPRNGSASLAPDLDLPLALSLPNARHRVSRCDTGVTSRDTGRRCEIESESVAACLRLFFNLLPAVRLVLPVRIELTTSPLPRECSTTELRQQARADARVS